MLSLAEAPHSLVKHLFSLILCIPISRFKLLRGIAQVIKTQRQKLGFNLKVRKAEQSVTGSDLYLSLKWRSCFQESQNEAETENCLLLFYIPFWG